MIAIKKSTLINLINQMIKKYELALIANSIYIGPNHCPLCIINNNICTNCVLQANTDSSCLNMPTFDAILFHEKKDFNNVINMRLIFWQTALREITQIWNGSFYLDINNVKIKLHKIDKELWERNQQL